MAAAVPVVDYLVLGDRPHLVAQECTVCGARFFDHRDACASCFSTEFTSAEIPTLGTLRTFTIVTVSAPGVPVPFVAGIVDCQGTSVRANIVNVAASTDHIRLGMPLRFTTVPMGADDNGTEAVGFGFEPANLSEGEY